MNSRLMSTVFDDPEAEHAKKFARHLRETLELSEDDRNACLNALPKIKNTPVRAERKTLMEKLANALDLPFHSIEHALAVANFLTDALLSDDIPHKDRDFWADDLQELGWIDQQTRPAFEAVLSQLVAKYDEFDLQRRQRRAAGGVFPSLNSFNCTVEIRPVQRDRFRWGEPIEDYKPQILGTVSVASIQIGVDDGLVKDIFFQAEESDIDLMIESLVAAKKDMAAFRRFLEFDHSTSVKTDE